jgi:hypothetical protein
MNSDTREEAAVDLRAFVSPDHWRRSYRLAPWSAGRWTYATNGVVVVRVPRRVDFDVDVDAPSAKIDEWLDEPGEPQLRAMPAADYNPPAKTCSQCWGRGTVHDCPSCDCDCESCNGSGEAPARWSVEWFGVHVDGNFWQQIATLPGARIGTEATRFGHLRFTFDGGGAGAVMPLWWPCEASKRLTPEAAPWQTGSGTFNARPLRHGRSSTGGICGRTRARSSSRSSISSPRCCSASWTATRGTPRQC